MQDDVEDGVGPARSGTAPIGSAAPPHLSGVRSVEIERDALGTLAAALGAEMREPFNEAVAAILDAPGRVIVTGIGKSGHIGRKIASTLASTGTPAAFVHASEASHGDLGMISSDDVILALSWSGETQELGDLISFSRRYAVRLVAITSSRDSTLGHASDVVLLLPTVREACPHNLAPTASSAMQLALGDALAIALLEARGFSALDFKQFHPGGKLAARLKSVDQLMHAGSEVPLVASGTPMSEVLLAITSKRFGCVGVVGHEGELAGIVTDGDLRRHMGVDILHRSVDEVMTRDPVSMPRGTLASAALELMNRRRITTLFVVEGRSPAGILHIHDLLRAGIA
ncbi:KpsF/GutQ family sugar-phosphate isomerase [Enterovirga sp.]|jgi:arabinose-5-phosphate isomerase|uniref:KpsF/GutQ family sugar-phosphate isomerase n=1 Tax=Enterovirga sp. TaxID=2026350 RepID=UPI00260DFE54|nr:KpsF/GutQ family sugar-phosphate isomerase [Enterovirga sp.]MDB5589519.1 KpsF/GutQ family protein [Enterovirga sp.]